MISLYTTIIFMPVQRVVVQSLPDKQAHNIVM